MQFYQIEVESYLSDSWEVCYRYSDFLKFYLNLKKVTATAAEDDFFFGLRCMLEEDFVSKSSAIGQSGHQHLQTEPSLGTPSLRLGTKMNSDVGSSSFLVKPLRSSYQSIHFPSKKWFRMS
jgi:hypothetical protein